MSAMGVGGHGPGVGVGGGPGGHEMGGGIGPGGPGPNHPHATEYTLQGAIVQPGSGVKQT